MMRWKKRGERRCRRRGSEQRSEGERGKGGARLSWSAASRLCGPCVPARRKLARQGKGTHTRAHTKFPKAIHLLNANTLYTHLYNTVQSLKSTSAHTHATHQTHTHTQSLAHVWLSDRLLLHLSARINVFWFRTGENKSIWDVFVASRGQTNPDSVSLSLYLLMIHFCLPFSLSILLLSSLSLPPTGLFCSLDALARLQGTS